MHAHLLVYGSSSMALAGQLKVANTLAQSTYANFPPPSLRQSTASAATCAHFSPHGAYLATGTHDGRVAMFRLRHYERY